MESLIIHRGQHPNIDRPVADGENIRTSIAIMRQEYAELTQRYQQQQGADGQMEQRQNICMRPCTNSR